MKLRVLILHLGITAILLINIIAHGADQGEIPPMDESISHTEMLNISTATFRYQFTKNQISGTRTTQSYFLSIFGKDPSASLMFRFRNHHPSVKCGSEFEVGKGISLSISQIRRNSSSTVTVYGKVYRAGLAAYWATYTLEKKDGTWSVIDRTIYRRS